MIPIVCLDCGETGEVAKVAAKMRHDCGSEQVELWEGTPEQLSRIASRETGTSFAEFMTRQGAQRGMPAPVEADPQYPGYVGDEIAGWDEYTGPPPSPNPFNAPQHSGPGAVEPTKKTPGVVEPSNIYVYDKHNPPEGYGENPPPPLVAPHNYPSHVTHTPFLGQRREETVEGIGLDGASCPRCFAPKTAIVADYREHAHWFCHEKCGSLVDLDKHPYLNPYQPDVAFGLSRGWGRDSYRKEKRAFAGKRDGVLLRRIAAVARTNRGLDLSETLFLARQSVIQYPEA